MPRPIHAGRGSTDPFADGAVTAAETAMAHALPERCRFGTITSTRNPDPPYGTTDEFDAVATDVPCAVEPADDRPVDVAGDPSNLALFDVRVPHGTALAADHTIEVAAGRNADLQLQVIEVHDSSTEPLLRATCKRITGGEP